MRSVEDEMTHDPPGSVPPDPEAASPPANLAGRPDPETPPDVSPEDWAALGSTRVLAGSNPMDTENASAAPPPSDAEGAARIEGANQRAVNTLGDYRLVKKLGEGAMGVVYKARQISFGREVAVKVLFKHIAANPKLVERFYREARVAGRLDHPNIVQGFEVGEDQGWHYFAMEYVDGESLQKILHRVGRLSVGDAVHILLRCAAGLHHAHAHEVVHRDVKPDNVLITRQGEVKIADLGMVKQLDEDMSLTQTGHAVGTPWYMPLEQARNAKEADHRCDIYALGCVFYCLLTGQPPFTGRTLVDVIQAKEVGTFAPARRTNPDVTEKLDLVILKMTAKEVKYRYASCAEVIRDLEALGLANPRLSFLSQPPPAAVPKSGRLKAQPTPVMQPPSTAERPTPAAPTAAPQPPPDLWYVRVRTGENEVTLRKMTTAQVLVWIESDLFDPATKVSRNAKEGYRTPATYKEFQAAVLGRAARSGADKQTSRFRKEFKKLEEQDLQRRQEEARGPEVDTTSYWLGIFWRVAAVVGVLGVLVLIGQLVINAFRGVLW